MRKTLYLVKSVVYRRRLRQYRAARSKQVCYPRVLVLMNGGVGNAIEATPLVQALRMRWPQSHITILSPPGDLFGNWCVVDQVATRPEDLPDRAFDMTFQTHAVEQLPGKICTPDHFGRVYKPPFVGRQFLKAEREYNTDMARQVGFRGASPPLYVTIRKPDLKLPETGLSFVLAPGGKPDHKWRYKRWPYYRQLVQALLEKYADASVYVVGTRQDDFENPAPDNARLNDLRSRLSLSETAWLMQHATVSIGNDCGPMHIADAVQADALVIFGPTCEIKNGPLYKAMIISSDVDCRPCQYDEATIMSCADPICVDRLSVEKVMVRISATVVTSDQVNGGPVPGQPLDQPDDTSARTPNLGEKL